MKNLSKKIAVASLSAVLVTTGMLTHSNIYKADTQATTTTQLADAEATKEEVVYANLSATGAVNEVYVVNVINVKQSGKLTDYGNYATVKNLVNTDEMTQNGEAVTVVAPVGNFYYQGNMASKDLPWNVNISYYFG